MCPGSVEIGQEGAGHGSDDYETARNVGNDSLDDVGDDGEADLVQDKGLDTPPARKATSLGNEVPDCTADARGNRRTVDDGDGWASLEERLLLLLRALFFGWGDSDGSGRSLHHGERGDNIFEGVLNLAGVSCALHFARGTRDNLQHSRRRQTQRMSTPR